MPRYRRRSLCRSNDDWRHFETLVCLLFHAAIRPGWSCLRDARCPTAHRTLVRDLSWVAPIAVWIQPLRGFCFGSMRRRIYRRLRTELLRRHTREFIFGLVQTRGHFSLCWSGSSGGLVVSRFERESARSFPCVC